FHHPIHLAVWSLRVPGRLLECCGAAGLAVLVQLEPGGRRDRRLPLVYARWRKSALHAWPPDESRCHRFLPVAWYRLLQTHRAQLCGSALIRWIPTSSSALAVLVRSM